MDGILNMTVYISFRFQIIHSFLPDICIAPLDLTVTIEASTDALQSG